MMGSCPHLFARSPSWPAFARPSRAVWRLPLVPRRPCRSRCCSPPRRRARSSLKSGAPKVWAAAPQRHRPPVTPGRGIRHVRERKRERRPARQRRRLCDLLGSGRPVHPTNGSSTSMASSAARRSQWLGYPVSACSPSTATAATRSRRSIALFKGSYSDTDEISRPGNARTPKGTLPERICRDHGRATARTAAVLHRHSQPPQGYGHRLLPDYASRSHGVPG